MAQQTTAVRKQMLFVYLPNFSLCAFCSCLTVKSFKTNKQMVTDYTEATAFSAQKLPYNWWAKFTLGILLLFSQSCPGSFSIHQRTVVDHLLDLWPHGKQWKQWNALKLGMGDISCWFFLCAMAVKHMVCCFETAPLRLARTETYRRWKKR